MRKYCNNKPYYGAQYYYGNDEPLNHCLATIPPDSRKIFVVCMASEARTKKKGEWVNDTHRKYAWYKSIDSFILEYVQIPLDDRMFFEVLCGPCRECYDIDLDLTVPEKKAIWDKFGDTLVPLFLKARHHFITYESDWYTISNEPDISTSHGQNKISFHITFGDRNYGFSKIEDMMPFILEFKAYLEERNLDFGIDYKIYTKRRNMRLLYSRKPFSDRFLVPLK